MTAITKKPFPKALPFRAPEESIDPSALWRRRTYGVIAAATAITLVSISAVVLVLKDARAAKLAASIVAEQPLAAVELPTPTSPPAPGIVAAKFKPVLPVEASVISSPKKVPEPISAPKRDLSTPQRERYLEALGSLSAAQLYQSYLNIGLLADSVEGETYTLKEAEETLRSVTDLMDQVEGQLETLAKVGLEPEDNAAIAQIKAVSALLRLQAKCLRDYWMTGNSAKADEYHEVRKTAWKGLTKILQVDAK